MKPRYSDEDFRARLVTGFEQEGKIAKYFSSHGFDVEQGQFSFHEDKISRYTKNQNDLVVNGKLIEVKSRKLALADGYPYPDAIVDTVDGFKKKKIKPFAYVITSQTDDVSLFFLVADTQKYWTEYRNFDRARRLPQVEYRIEKKFLRPISEIIKEL